MPGERIIGYCSVYAEARKRRLQANLELLSNKKKETKVREHPETCISSPT